MMHNAELMRQNEAHRARQARLWGKTEKIAPVIAAPVPESVPRIEPDYHVWLFRMHRILYPLGMQTEASFSFEPSMDYLPYQPELSIEPLPEIRKQMKMIATEVLVGYPGITLEMLRSNRRDRAVTDPRQMIMYEIRKQQPWRSFPEIGRFLHRDHTVALHAINKMKALLEGDEESAARVAQKKARTARYHANKAA